MSWAQRDILKQTQKWRPKGLAREPCDDDGDDDGDDDEQRENAAPSVRAASHADYTPCATPPHLNYTLRTLYMVVFYEIVSNTFPVPLHRTTSTNKPIN